MLLMAEEYILVCAGFLLYLFFLLLRDRKVADISRQLVTANCLANICMCVCAFMLKRGLVAGHECMCVCALDLHE